MSSNSEEAGRPCWFVGAAYEADDQLDRFLSQGIWKNGYTDKYLEKVKAIQVGDRIAIKSTFVRKHDLPFDNRGHSVSVMAIKATGRVTENLGDGRVVKVNWKRIEPPHIWYFYTNRKTIWKVTPGEWEKDGLIEFAFDDKPQDIARFRNSPFWQDRFGDATAEKPPFEWTRFYEAMADKILTYKDRRPELVAGIHAIAAKFGLSYFQDQFADGSSGPLKDICPFTTMGIFNRGNTDVKRNGIANELADFLGVTERAPESFEGIPCLNNQNSWFFAYEKQGFHDRKDDLWRLFSAAIAFADSEDSEMESEFIAAYDHITETTNLAAMLTMGLFWIRPWTFPTLDGQSRPYIRKKLNVQIAKNGPKGRCTATDYLALADTLKSHFKEDAYAVHSFPELSLAALHNKDRAESAPADDEDQDLSDFENDDILNEPLVVRVPVEPYGIEDILTDGCFLARERIEQILERLRSKKNLILQGPPGTGKTWLARRLAFALMEERDEMRVRAVQFHPNLSYEDFIRGWRPAGDGRLSLVDGPFVEAINAALRDPDSIHVLVIEEINRGNPAQIFGEMLTLLEADKRRPSEALELSYKRSDGERVYIPGNLHVIGTMNIADRSLALVDLALRRRFAFVDLEPALGKPWRDWVSVKCGIDMGILLEIEKRLITLNKEIADDHGLGPQFRVGHSYVTPSAGTMVDDAQKWFRQIVETEIGPLLDEYWFDALDRSRKSRERLLEGF